MLTYNTDFFKKMTLDILIAILYYYNKKGFSELLLESQVHKA